MNGVNDLAERWGRQANTASVQSMEFEDNAHMLGRMKGRYEMLDECSAEVDEIARTAWRPVSEPPTEADGDGYGCVLVYVPADEEGPAAVAPWPWRNVESSSDEDTPLRWARIRDVVLMPEGESD